ncbi:MAG: hypothetical protein ACFB13_18820 [Kiloniellaceae bacterium]
MKLPVFRTVGTTFVFGLRHFPVFYLLCLLISLPSILYCLLTGQSEFGQLLAVEGWKGDLLRAVETVLSAFVTAVMVWTLMRDRQGEGGTAIAALRDAFERTPTILGVGVAFAVGTTLFSVLRDVLTEIHPGGGIGLSVAMMFVGLYFAVAVPCAAVDSNGVMDCFSRSVNLTQGSRLRILLTYCLVCIPLVIAIFIFFVIMDPGSERIEGLPVAWFFFGGPGLYIFFLTAQVAMHENLAGLEDGMAVGETAAVFD